MKPQPVILKVWSSEVAELIDRQKRIGSDQISSTPYIVFKVNSKLLNHIAGSIASRKQIAGRFPGKLNYLLEYDKSSAKHNIYLVNENSLEHIEKDDLLKSIREFDLLEIVNSSTDSIIYAPEGTHFITPSLKHTKKFLRLADALHSYNALDRLSYWLQSEMQMIAGIVIDTWSLSSIVLGTQLLLPDEEIVPFDCFHRHIKNDEEEAEIVLRKLTKRMKSDKPLLCLVSVSSSGTFYNVLDYIAKKSNINNELKILSLYKFNDTPNNIEALATLDFPLQWYESTSSCEYCNNGEKDKTYTIDPKFYYPREHKEGIVRIRSSILRSEDGRDDSSACKFIHNYGNRPGVLRVHRNDPNDGINPRHHAFYIDVATLLECAEFKNELYEALEKLRRDADESIVIVTPPHSAGLLLAKIACEHLGAECVSHQNLRNLSNDDLALLASANHIIFLDDVLITGSRIKEYLRSLREEIDEEILMNLTRVTWFPIIARPSNETKIDSIIDSLRMHKWENDLIYLYKIILPEWFGNKNCPWCQESAILENSVGALFEEPEWYAERRNILVYGQDDGIYTSPLFLLPGIARGTAGGSSPIAKEGSSEIQIIFLFATILQCMRNNKIEPLGKWSLFNNYVLTMFRADNPKASTFVRFSEALFQAVLLRVVKCEEWSQDVKLKGAEDIANLLEGGSSNILLGESILFLHRILYDDKLPAGIVNALKMWPDEKVVNLLVSRFS